MYKIYLPLFYNTVEVEVFAVIYLLRYRPALRFYSFVTADIITCWLGVQFVDAIIDAILGISLYNSNYLLNYIPSIRALVAVTLIIII